MKYLIIQHPGHNRVYYKESAKLAIAELRLACARMTAKCSAIELSDVEGISYLSFEADRDLGPSDIDLLSRLSFIFALFEARGQGVELSLKPLRLANYHYLDDKISNILKYKGKTNELFTKMMINVALLTSDFNYRDKIRLLDPVAGKGTTLCESLVYGFNATGVEIEQKSVHEMAVFFRKYMEEERIKHSFNKRKITGQKKSDAILIQELEFARSKEEYKAAKTLRRLGMACADTRDIDRFFNHSSFHLIVGDLPYGVFHSNTTGKSKVQASRNPAELMTESIKVWGRLLKPGGAIVMAWNSHLVSRHELGDIISSSGLEYQVEAPYDGFEHKVDRSIKRDIVVARKVK